jgi:hypothetical protein
MKTGLIATMAAMAAWVLLSFQQYDPYPGTNLRGKVMSLDQAGNPFPLTDVKVDLYQYDFNAQKWVMIAGTVTDAYGFYYFPAIQPGNYSVQVKQSKNYEITVIRIDYKQFQYQDLPILYF